MKTSREVIDNLMRGKTAERIGFMESFWTQTLEKWVGQGYPTDEEGKPVDTTAYFDFDMASIQSSWFSWGAAGLDAGEIIEETEEWKIVRDATGTTLKWWKHKMGTPEHIGNLMTSREIWEKDYKPRFAELPRQRVTDNAIANTKEELEKQREQNRWTYFGGVFVWEEMRHCFGDVSLYENLLLDPDWIHDYCRTYTDFYKKCYTTLFEEAGKPDGVWIYEDMGYKNSLFCSPATYDKLVFPYFREIVDFFHGYDLPVVLHTCGFEEPLIDMIVDAGFCALNPMENKAGNDSLRIAEKSRGKIALIGGLDARVLESGNRGLIRMATTNLLNGMKDRGTRYVFASDHSLSPNVRLKDYEYAVDIYRNNMMYSEKKGETLQHE